MGSKNRVRVMCCGVARELKFKCSGRRNMLGTVLGPRRCKYFSGTSAILGHVFRSNKKIQLNYRLPINKYTHDPDCHKDCVSTMQNKKLMFLT